jgi:hypothetical protein
MVNSQGKLGAKMVREGRGGYVAGSASLESFASR